MLKFYKSILKRFLYFVLSKFSLFTNGMQETLTCHFSFVTSRFNDRG